LLDSLDYKGLALIYEDIDKDVVRNFDPNDKSISTEKRKLVQKEYLKKAKNAKFLSYYEQALEVDSEIPIKIKILNKRSDLKKIEKKNSEKAKLDTDESKNETEDQIIIKEEPILTKEEFNKIAFVYMFRKIEEFDFEIEKVKEIPSLIKKLGDFIRTKYKEIDSFFDENGKLRNEPYSLNISSTLGSITPITSMDHLYSIVRKFEGQSKVYFNIKPYFDIDTKAILAQAKKNPEEDEKAEVGGTLSDIKVSNSSDGKYDSDSNILSEQNFYETLDELTRGKMLFISFRSD
jgi:hypothetical protein